MVRTRSGRAKLAEEGVPLSPSQSLPNEPRRREPAAKKKKKTRRRPSSPPAEDTSEPQPQPTQEPTQEPTQGPTNDPMPDHMQDSTSPPSEELLETKLTRRQTSKYTTSEPQTQSRTYRTGETQTSIFPPYGLPQVPFPGQSEVHVQLGWNNPHLQEDERILSLNLPAEVLPAMLSFVTQHPQLAGTDLSHQLEVSPLFQQLMRDHDNDRVQILTVIPGAKKRKREQEPTIESILEAKIQKDRKDRHYLRSHPTPSTTDRQRLRQARIDETENILQECRDSRANEPRRKRTCTKLIPDLYDEDGNLRLGRYKKVEFEVDDGPEVEQGLADTQEQTFGNPLTENNLPQQHEPASTNDATPFATEMTDKASKLIEMTEDPYNESEIPYINVPLEETFPEEKLQNQTHAEPETPRARSWGLTNIIPSSVAKFIPFSSHRATPATTPSQPSAPSEPQVLDEAKPPPRTNYRAIMLSDTRLKRERDTQNDKSILRVHSQSHPPAADVTPHHQVAKPGDSQKSKEGLEQELRAKIEAEYKAKALEESEKLTAALKRKVNEVNKRDKRVERERTKIAQHLDEIIPGSKRKRMPSPEVIPNPAGGGFGMDLDYFYISDADSDEEDETPVRRPQTKKARTSSQEFELIGGSIDNHGTPMRRPQTKKARTSSQESELVGGSRGNHGTPMQRPQTKKARTSSQEFELIGGSTGNHGTPMRRHQTMKARTSSQEFELIGGSTGNGEASSTSQVGSPIIATFSSNTDVNMSSPRNVFETSLSPQTTPDYAPGPTMTFKVPSPTSSDDDSELDLESQQGVAAPVSPLASKSLAPQQRPAANYTAMPTPSHLVEKARQKALMHQPKTGSSLRNASRLSSFTAGSDPVEEQSKAEDSAECEQIYQDFLNTHSNSYQEFIKGVSPKVQALINATWTEQDNIAAEKAFASGMENFDEAEAEAWINGELEAWKAAQIAGAAA